MKEGMNDYCHAWFKAGVVNWERFDCRSDRCSYQRTSSTTECLCSSPPQPQSVGDRAGIGRPDEDGSEASDCGRRSYNHLL